MARPEPVAAGEFSSLMARLGPFERRPVIAVATSGGPDSLALALLAGDWATALGGRAVALTVDHRLRPESDAEARQVGRWLRARGIAHRVLVSSGARPHANVQAVARGMRYDLLSSWCLDAGVLHLLLAHHIEDQAETILLRLGRGSGVVGLAAMAAVVEGAGLRLLRPVLTVSRARLRATLEARGQPWLDDPSNRDRTYARVRVRALLPALGAEGMTPARLADTARRLGRARQALEVDVASLLARATELYPEGYCLLDRRLLARAPAEIGLRALASLLVSIGGHPSPPRLERLTSVRSERTMTPWVVRCSLRRCCLSARRRRLPRR